MSCGCQRRTAVNGTSACSSCVETLNAKLNAEAAAQTQNTTPHTTQNEWGAHRYKKA
jgi:Tfp pilus assembly protein PilN